MKKAIIVTFIAIIVIASGSFYYYVGTPSYSLYKLKKAIQNHDSASFNKYVDVDRIVDDLMNTAVAQTEKEMGDLKDNPFGELGMTIAKGLMSSMKEQMKTEINKSIEEISENKDDKYSKVEIENIVKEGKSAKVTLVNSEGDTIKMDMIEMPGRYWRIVSVNFDDFKKINPELSKKSDSEENNVKEKAVVIEKNIGDSVELATMKFTVNSVEEKQTIAGSFGDATPAKENAKFIVIDMSVTNTTNEGFDFDDDDFIVIDDKGRKFNAYDDTIGNVKNYLDMRELQPSLTENGVFVFEIPNDAESYWIMIGKKGTNEDYKVKLK